MLADMGFTPEQARKALRETVRRAFYFLLKRAGSHGGAVSRARMQSGL